MARLAKQRDLGGAEIDVGPWASARYTSVGQSASIASCDGGRFSSCLQRIPNYWMEIAVGNGIAPSNIGVEASVRGARVSCGNISCR